MKWIKENKCKSLIAFFGVFVALFAALDAGFDFWEEHVKAKPAPVPENYIEPERVDLTKLTTERLIR